MVQLVLNPRAACPQKDITWPLGCNASGCRICILLQISLSLYLRSSPAVGLGEVAKAPLSPQGINYLIHISQDF